jgi:ABC-type molybdenum transport system ATPase subunit/photorepair protein PhrA
MTSNNHSYYHFLELEGINCFRDKQKLDLSDGKAGFSKWTIILGDNGTGKTTLLRVLVNPLIFHNYYNSEKFLNQKQPLNIIVNNDGMFRNCNSIY